MCDFSHVRHLESANSLRQKVEEGLSGAGGKKNEELLFNGPRVSVWNEGIFLELNSEYINVTESYPKKSKNGKFYVVYMLP